MRTPITQGLLKSTAPENVRVILDTPQVKSAKTRELSLYGVTGNSKTGKTADHPCYASPAGEETGPAVGAAGLFETVNQERHMTLLKWWRGSNGNLFADHPVGRFCISDDVFPIGGRIYHIALNGDSRGGAPTLDGAKRMAIELAENNGHWKPRAKAS